MSHSRRPPELSELRGLCMAAQLGSINLAAQRLHLSQPTLSRRLAALEAGLGVELFERSSHGVSLTADGERIYAHALRVLAEVEHLDSAVERIGTRQPLVRLAISHTAVLALLPDALLAVNEHTNIPVETVIANSQIVRERVRAGQADFGVAACVPGEPESALSAELICEDELVVAVPMGHRWSRGAAVSLAELQRTPVVARDPAAHSRRFVDAVLESHGLGALRAAREVGLTEVAKAEAKRTGLPVILSRCLVSMADGLEVVALKDARFLRAFAIVKKPGPLPRAARLLADAFHENARRAGASERAGQSRGT